MSPIYHICFILPTPVWWNVSLELHSSLWNYEEALPGVVQCVPLENILRCKCVDELVWILSKLLKGVVSQLFLKEISCLFSKFMLCTGLSWSRLFSWAKSQARILNFWKWIIIWPLTCLECESDGSHLMISIDHRQYPIYQYEESQIFIRKLAVWH